MSASPRKKRHVTAESDKLSVGRKLALGTGGITETFSNSANNNLANPILNITLHVNPALVGIALAIPRLWDAITDPVVGSLSDRTRTRWGRRRPYIFCGAILSGLLFIAMWALPRDASEAYYISYFIALSLVFYSATTLFVIPWGSLLIEASPDYHERTRIQAFKSYFGVIGGVALPWLYPLVQSSIFRDPIEGVLWVAAGVGAIIAISGVVPALFVRENALPLPTSSRPIPVTKFSLRQVVGDVRQSFANRPFVLCVLILLMLGPCLAIMEGLGLYVNIYHVYGGNTVAAASMQATNHTIYFLSKFFWVPVVAWAATRIGKQRTMWCGLSITLVSDVLKWFAYTPDAPWLQLMVPVLSSPGLATVWVVLNSMIGDTTDYDEWRTGQSRTGLFLSVSQWARKLALTLTGTFAGIMLVVIGFKAELGVNQDPMTIVQMRLLFAGVPTVTTITGMILLYFYPLDENRVYAIRRVLDRRRRSVAAKDPGVAS